MEMDMTQATRATTGVAVFTPIMIANIGIAITASPKPMVDRVKVEINSTTIVIVWS
jgi:hypothetical protein